VDLQDIRMGGVTDDKHIGSYLLFNAPSSMKLSCTKMLVPNTLLSY
jgi:hypothetical protein